MWGCEDVGGERRMFLGGWGEGGEGVVLVGKTG